MKVTRRDILVGTGAVLAASILPAAAKEEVLPVWPACQTGDVIEISHMVYRSAADAIFSLGGDSMVIDLIPAPYAEWKVTRAGELIASGYIDPDGKWITGAAPQHAEDSAI